MNQTPAVDWKNIGALLALLSKTFAMIRSILLGELKIDLGAFIEWINDECGQGPTTFKVYLGKVGEEFNRLHKALLISVKKLDLWNFPRIADISSKVKIHHKIDYGHHLELWHDGVRVCSETGASRPIIIEKISNTRVLDKTIGDGKENLPNAGLLKGFVDEQEFVPEEWVRLSETGMNRPFFCFFGTIFMPVEGEPGDEFFHYMYYSQGEWRESSMGLSEVRVNLDRIYFVRFKGNID